MSSFLIRPPHKVLFRWTNLGGWDQRGTWHIWGKRERHKVLSWRNLREREYLEGLAVVGRIILKLDLREIGQTNGLNVRVAQDRDKWQGL
jgi:predicted GNAT family N-acyltransferase